MNLITNEVNACMNEVGNGGQEFYCQGPIHEGVNGGFTVHPCPVNESVVWCPPGKSTKRAYNFIIKNVRSP